jgi:hypothetical protein
VAICSAELTGEKRLNKIPSYRRSNGPATHTDHVHVVILHALSSREMIVNEPGADADDLVGAHGSANPAAANCYSPKDIARGYSASKRNYYVRIVVVGIQLMRAEINHIVSGRAQLV